MELRFSGQLPHLRGSLSRLSVLCLHVCLPSLGLLPSLSSRRGRKPHSNNSLLLALHNNPRLPALRDISDMLEDCGPCLVQAGFGSVFVSMFPRFVRFRPHHLRSHDQKHQQLCGAEDRWFVSIYFSDHEADFQTQSVRGPDRERWT